MIFGDPLFGRDDLDSYLRAQVGAIDEHVRRNVSKADLTQTDAEIANRLLVEARVDGLTVDFERPQKEVSEARVEVHDAFDGPVTIDGVRATRSFAFRGDPALFKLRTNPFSSVCPRGRVQGDRIVIGIEGRNDPGSLKQEIDRQEQLLREYTGWSSAQTDAHNAGLEALLTVAVSRRRRTLASLDDLRDKI